MKTIMLLLSLLFLALLISALPFDESVNRDRLREKGQKLQSDGDFKSALEIFLKLIRDKENDPRLVGGDLTRAIQCLNSLNRTDEIDALLDETVALHGDHWQLLGTAARNYMDAPHFGYIVAGEFYRGNVRGSGQYVSCQERDRVKALGLMTRAMDLTGGEENATLLSDYYLTFAAWILSGREGNRSWRLQSLTDVKTLPDYEDGYYRGYGDQYVSAPVDEDGNPLFYALPESYGAARSDGERWRWLLEKAVEISPERDQQVTYTFADFLYSQFGVQTMARYASFFGRDPGEGESQTFALHTLSENETLANLATGVKRFDLPKEYNFIALYRKIAEGKKSGYAEQAWNTLAQIFENRRQYDKAADCWLESIERYGPGSMDHKVKRRNQILDPSGRLEPAPSQAAGKGAVLDYRFRNGTRVFFEARAIDEEKLLKDVKAYLNSNPDRLDWNELNVMSVGYRIVEQGHTQYLGEKVASWDLELAPRKGHFDRRITVTTPLQKAGAYLVTAKMKDGNTSQAVVWVNDTVIVQKPLDKGVFFYVADAMTGRPVEKANVEIFGFYQEWLPRDSGQGRRKSVIHTTNFAGFTDKEGQLFLDDEDLDNHYRWLVMARTDSGRLAYLGFNGIWYRGNQEPLYNQAKAFLITDRPVYRPDQAVKIKCWIRRACYDMEDRSEFAHISSDFRIYDPKGEEFYKNTFTTDAYGGFDGEITLPRDATLGVYQLWTPYGSSSFRVEEYKKPEFEVTVEAPQEPLLLGEKIKATIKADYYFGAPVTKASVHYKVFRHTHSATWYPLGCWDWFYGPGYWWFAYDYYWYPGWREWGMHRPRYEWIPWHEQEPELVMDEEVPIGEDGTVAIEIDTAFVKEVHGNEDHRYEITAEVRDESRRTVVGSGRVLAARKPFKVYAWVDRGFYRVGDAIEAKCSALTLDQKPVIGKGEARLFKIAYDGTDQPVESVVKTLPVATSETGEARLKMTASEPGQYRVSFTIVDAKGRTEEGGQVFCVRGEGFDGSDFRFNDLELIPDRKEYAPGDKVSLMINTDRVDSTVVLFVKPCEGVYPKPRIFRMQGKSALVEIEVTKSDMPNFFVEAFTINDGRFHSELKEIVVPPEKRVLDLEVLPSAKEYKPGEEAVVRLFLKDLEGKPVQGQAALTVYDRSLEYISGGSNVPEIKAFFWKWRKNHYPWVQWNMTPPGSERIFTEPSMNNLGIFGHIVPSVDFDEARGGAMSPPAPTEQLKSLGYLDGGAAGRSRAMEGVELSMAEAEAPSDMAKDDKGDGSGQEPTVQPVVRTQLADTAFWAALIETDADGFAEVSFKMPDNLTAWKIKAWAVSHGTRVGEGQAEAKTKKNLLLRMQAPRFFVEKDEVVLSANVHNYLAAGKNVKVRLELDGDSLSPMGPAEQDVTVASMGEERVDFRVEVKREGEAVIRMLALTDEESDAMEMRFPVFVHGMEKTVSFCGGMNADQGEARLAFFVPEERRVNESRLEIRYSPSVACAMVDALPYLADYPYGCTEQTLNRFVPAVITQKILREMGLDLTAIRDKRVNLNAQELGDPTERAARWKHWKRKPVFDEETLDDMVREGLKRLTNMQLSDGGWGWFSGWGEHSTAHTTSVVVHGLQAARDNGAALVPGMLDRGIAWLKAFQQEQITLLENASMKIQPWKTRADDQDALIYSILGDEGAFDPKMGDFLFRDRLTLSAYGKALLGLAFCKEGRREALDRLLTDLDQLLVQDAENQTAWLNLRDASWWYWYGSEYESNASYLKLLARVDPRGPKAAGLAKYLVNNRRHGTWWNSTRDTALCIEALADFIRASGEHRPDMTLQILIDGQKRKEVRITEENLFSFDGSLVLLGDAVEGGEHEITFRKTGTGPLYFNAYLTYFSLEDHITAAGLEVKVQRAYYRLDPVDKEAEVAGSHGQVVREKREKYERVPIENLSTLKSGDLVEIELTIESKNDYEYLIFEDMKAAGFEPFEVRSGYAGDGLRAYMELRDEKVCFFVPFLSAGKHSIAFRMRAEIPGRYSALPTRAFAMYAPELKGNSDELKINIED